MSTSFINYNSTLQFENSAIFDYNEDYSQPYFNLLVPSSSNSEDILSHNFYINLDHNLPPGWAYYDYFNSGEIFLNMPQEFSCLDSVNFVNFLQLFSFCNPKHHANNDSQYSYEGTAALTLSISLLSEEESSNTHVNPIIMYDMELQSLKYFFKVSDVFYFTQESSSPLQKSPKLLCENFSILSSKLDILSHKYEFANRIEGIPTCSKFAGSGKLVPCVFQANHSSCPMFSPKEETISSVSITSTNNDVPLNISLKKLQTLDTDPSYVIFNDTLNTDIHNIFFPSYSDLSENEVLNHVSECFQEVISPYENSEIEYNPISNSKEVVSKNSFISSIA